MTYSAALLALSNGRFTQSFVSHVPMRIRTQCPRRVYRIGGGCLHAVAVSPLITSIQKASAMIDQSHHAYASPFVSFCYVELLVHSSRARATVSASHT
ncbi:hypothetical protein BU26DRAFT_203044 [Trematosphaeria pertusa]|uniref:Uncharacterized protein n=1 Tax=Trematosphaeria pertusa TaxID=390896 RepID=A0A6A6HRG1_9PLEO|nr:uncharacterized protein BU26DRAFT_203044 [Trematosphaeria pertusa]KAF2240601.1 hypothetical protein BU26DRAFT_203044 [Trematosphaeria pertusa]